VHEVAGAPGVAADLHLDERGAPIDPVRVFDATGPGAREAGNVARHLGDSLAVTVLVADAGTAPALIEAADVVLSAEPDAAGRAVVVEDPRGAAETVVRQVEASPRAALSLAWLLRLGEAVPVAEALAAESAVYSSLLGGPDFARWLEQRGPARPSGPRERVRVTRDGDEVRVTLVRVGRRNAVDAAMRGALLEALEIARWDERVRVTVDAEGPSFSAGGDLDEFGSARDLATAHVVRVAASVGLVIHRLRDRVTVRVHGDCIGAGLELPPFAGRVVARGDARFRLPEIGMGLVPGAGGTVSLPRRISRQRTAWLALSGDVIDASTALAWGLVDEIE
jgi:enoyl-CoA hydratase/isomerase-like protein